MGFLILLAFIGVAVYLIKNTFNKTNCHPVPSIPEQAIPARIQKSLVADMDLRPPPSRRIVWVLDTNVILEFPQIHVFLGDRVVIPMTVIRELDNLKDSEDKLIARNARQFSRILTKLGDLHGDLASEIPYLVKLKDTVATITWEIYSRLILEKRFEHIKDLSSNNDNAIVGTALFYKNRPEIRDHDGYGCERDVVLLTNDNNVKLVAQSYGIKVSKILEVNFSDLDLREVDERKLFIIIRNMGTYLSDPDWSSLQVGISENEEAEARLNEHRELFDMPNLDFAKSDKQ